MGLIDAPSLADTASGTGLINAVSSGGQIPPPPSGASNRVKLTLELSNTLNQTLENMAHDSGATKTEIIRKALALMEAANSAKNEGNQIGIVNRQGQLVTRILGL